MPAAVLLGFIPVRATEPASVSIVVNSDKSAIDFLAGKDLVGRYHIGPADIAKPYLWPLNGPGGVPMTRAWPLQKGEPGESKDHVHQKSAWFCHGDIIPQGIPLTSKIKGVDGVDFWSEAKGHGRIVCWKVAEPKQEKDHGQITTFNYWNTSAGQKVLDETRTIHLHDFGDTRLLVFDIDLLASAVPITFGDTKEGAFGIRINDAIREDRKEGKLENAEGKVGEKQCWGQLSAWCDYSGPLERKTVGLAILDDPRNPHPACWHSRAYGLMAANPFGRAHSGFPAMQGNTKLVTLAKGDHAKFRYGLLIHPGDAKEGKVADYFERFVKLRAP
jgi:hypothetical protein